MNKDNISLKLVPGNLSLAILASPTSPIEISSSSKNSPIHNTDNSYDAFDHSIPKYGSLEENAHDAPIYTYTSKCSESSNFPKFPTDKTPPNENMRNLYLNYIANNQLKNTNE